MTTIGDGVFEGHMSQHWNIADNPNGGYMVALATQAIEQCVEHPDPITLTTHFLRPGLPDRPCRVEVEVIKVGRTMSTVAARLIQQDKVRIAMLASYGDLSVSAGVDTELTVPAPDLPPPDECVQRSGDTQGIVLPILSRLDTRLDPGQAVAGSSDLAQISGHIRFSDDRPPDTRALALFADAFPPSPFALLGVVGWVPTVELTVHIRRRPAPGWIQAQFTTEDLYQGRMIENGGLWDSNGDLVAQSRQIGLVMQRSE